jgi:hypothetical protein
MGTPRIDYFDITKITDPRMLAEFQRAREQERHGQKAMQYVRMFQPFFGRLQTRGTTPL